MLEAPTQGVNGTQPPPASAPPVSSMLPVQPPQQQAYTNFFPPYVVTSSPMGLPPASAPSAGPSPAVATSPHTATYPPISYPGSPGYPPASYSSTTNPHSTYPPSYPAPQPYPQFAPASNTQGAQTAASIAGQHATNFSHPGSSANAAHGPTGSMQPPSGYPPASMASPVAPMGGGMMTYGSMSPGAIGAPYGAPAMAPQPTHMAAPGYGSLSHHSTAAINPYSYSHHPHHHPHAHHAHQPMHGRHRVTTTLWEDEGTLCFQVDARGVCVARRHDNNMINGTKLLNVCGMSRGKRDGILKNEKERIVVKVGAMHLKGVWITFERGKQLAEQNGIAEILYPLFETNISSFLYHPDNYPRTAAVMAAAQERHQSRQRTANGSPGAAGSTSTAPGAAPIGSMAAPPPLIRANTTPLGSGSSGYRVGEVSGAGSFASGLTHLPWQNHGVSSAGDLSSSVTQPGAPASLTAHVSLPEPHSASYAHQPSSMHSGILPGLTGPLPPPPQQQQPQPSTLRPLPPDRRHSMPVTLSQIQNHDAGNGYTDPRPTAGVKRAFEDDDADNKDPYAASYDPAQSAYHHHSANDGTSNGVSVSSMTGAKAMGSNGPSPTAASKRTKYEPDALSDVSGPRDSLSRNWATGSAFDTGSSSSSVGAGPVSKHDYRDDAFVTAAGAGAGGVAQGVGRPRPVGESRAL